MSLEISDLAILLIEPSDVQLKLIKLHLKKDGVGKISVASAGSDALTEMRRYEPDLVISSMYLPDMTAIDLVRTMRGDAQLEHIPFMLISSETRHKLTEPIRQAGVVAILPKPFDHTDLSNALRASLEHIEPSELLFNDLDVEDLNVLVVDDSLTARHHIERILNNFGFQRMTLVESAAEAIENLSKHAFDLVITDLNMPEMDGQQLVEYIRNDFGDSYIPILMITSEDNKSKLASLEKSGVTAIFNKPFEPSKIKEVLSKVLEEIA